jgi:hypothetical protein
MSLSEPLALTKALTSPDESLRRSDETETVVVKITSERD